MMIDRLEIIETANPRVMAVRLGQRVIGELIETRLGTYVRAPDDNHGHHRFGPFAEQEAAVSALVEFEERAP